MFAFQSLPNTRPLPAGIAYETSSDYEDLPINPLLTPAFTREELRQMVLELMG